MAFDTPIVFFIFCRPELTARVFAVIKQVKPTNLLVVADGPRCESEAALCTQTRDIIKQIDWDCNLRQNYSDRNLGCRERISSGINWAFEQVEEAIILEDDTLPDLRFFDFCAALLKRYRHNHRIFSIGGTNVLKDWKSQQQDYHYSYQGSIWGWATWKRAWAHYDVSMERWKNDAVKKDIRDLSITDNYYQIRENIFSQVANGNVDTWDTQWVFSRLSHKGLTVLPSKNLVSNLGFGVDATHTKNNQSRLSGIPSFSIEPPFKSPDSLIVDWEFEEKLLNLIFGKESHKKTGYQRFKKIAKTLILRGAA